MRPEDPVRIVDKILEMQKELEDSWGRFPNLQDEAAVSDYIRDTILCVEDELHELLHEVNWKPWKAAGGIRNISNYREELSDVLHFVLDLYLVAGLTGEDLVNDYFIKHSKNMRRVTDEEYLNK